MKTWRKILQILHPVITNLHCISLTIALRVNHQPSPKTRALFSCPIWRSTNALRVHLLHLAIFRRSSLDHKEESWPHSLLSTIKAPPQFQLPFPGKGWSIAKGQSGRRSFNKSLCLLPFHLLPLPLSCPPNKPLALPSPPWRGSVRPRPSLLPRG